MSKGIMELTEALVVGLDMIWSKKQMGKVRTAEMMVVRDQE
jgi:hypothetical protein